MIFRGEIYTNLLELLRVKYWNYFLLGKYIFQRSILTDFPKCPGVRWIYYIPKLLLDAVWKLKIALLFVNLENVSLNADFFLELWDFSVLLIW